MINTSSIARMTPSFRVLSDDQIQEIKDAAYEVLRTTGAKVLHQGAREMLAKAGAVVDGDRVKVPTHLILQALSTTPQGFTIYDRLGRPAMELRGRKVYFGTSTASPNSMDARTGEVRLTQLQDIKNGARIADALENIDFVMPFGSSQDVPGHLADLYEFPAIVSNTTKPVVFIAYSAQGLKLVYEMAAAVVGGWDRLRERPFVMCYPEPIAPLVYPVEVVDRLLNAAELDMPIIPGSTVQLGATGPMTVPGAVVQALAEALLSIVLAQLKRPGCRVCCSCNFGILDMSSALMTFGAPTHSLCYAAFADVAQSYGLPTWGLAGATDSKVVDAQAGIEATFHIFAQALSGLNIVHDVGYMDAAMACSAQQMVMGNTIIGMVKHYLNGFTVDADALAKEVIEQVGPGGQFITNRHTFSNFRNVLWTPSLVDRRTRGQWEAAGAKDMSQRIQEKTVQILDSHQPVALEPAVVEALEAIKVRGEKELTLPAK